MLEEEASDGWYLLETHLFPPEAFPPKRRHSWSATCRRLNRALPCLKALCKSVPCVTPGRGARVRDPIRIFSVVYGLTPPVSEPNGSRKTFTEKSPKPLGSLYPSG